MLFDHGSENYIKNAETDFKAIKAALKAKPEPKKDDKHKAGHWFFPLNRGVISLLDFIF